VLNDVRDKSLPQLAVDLRALTVGGWNERPGDLATAAKGLQAAMGGKGPREGPKEGGRGKRLCKVSKTTRLTFNPSLPPLPLSLPFPV